eukprot:TRINITY_DN1320_c0_g1_i4.p1 TRINITY_DN1320_c0_g1~~TRINITY_DN1320_c0_g1_i4.p1  ORF type:complete len:468 (+),score=58.33 TRINITY_DN1320_c0_g1_i4:140-1405(+)
MQIQQRSNLSTIPCTRNSFPKRTKTPSSKQIKRRSFKLQTSAKLLTKDPESITKNEDQNENKNLEELPLPPGKKSLPIIGHSLYFRDFSKLREFLDECRAEFGDIFKMDTGLLFGAPLVYIYYINSILYLLGEEHNLVGAGYGKNFVNMMGSRNLLVLRGKEHLKERQIVNKAFSIESVYHYLPAINSKMYQYCEKWAGKNEAVDLSQEAKELVFDVALRVVLGIEIPEEEVRNFASLYTTLMGGVFGVAFNYPGSKLNKSYMARDQLRNDLKKYLKEIVSNFKQGRYQKTFINIYMKSLVDNGEQLDIDKLAETSVAMLFAAYLTTSNTLQFLNYHMLTNPEIFQQIKNEQTQLIQQFGNEITLEFLQKNDGRRQNNQRGFTRVSRRRGYSQSCLERLRTLRVQNSQRVQNKFVRWTNHL